MSVNITVNGKFAKHCRTHPLLDDPQQVRKQEEQERRKLRLLQVREESKKLAKKIREDVNEEKKRQLQKLYATKEQEMECWRQHAIERTGEDYRSAIFQIGTAHKAARKERQDQAEKQKTQGSYKDFKKQVAARKCNPGKVKFNMDKSCRCQQSCPDKKMQCTCTQTEGCEKVIDEPHKRKRNSCFSSSDSEECDDEGYKEQTLPQSSFCSTSSSFDSSLSSVGNNRCTQSSIFVPTTKHTFHKTPAVFLDVEVGTDDSVTISAPAEVNDVHAQNNRQFSSVIRVSPSKSLKTKENKAENSQNQPSSGTTTSSATATMTSTSSATKSSEPLEEEQEICKSTKTIGKAKPPQPRVIQSTKEKRFTLISDIVRKQQDHNKPTKKSTLPPQTCSSNQTECLPPVRPMVSRATSETVSPQFSPRKQTRPAQTTRPTIARPSPQPSRKASAASSTVTPQLSPRKQARPAQTTRPTIDRRSPQASRKASAASSKSSRAVTEKSQPLSNVTTTVNTGVVSACSSSGKVQFYDYSSKISRDCVQTLAKVQRQNDVTQPTAMEQAALENQREMERQQELLQKCKQVEERGQKAIEREQVRRDCNELTEKLEALTREYPKQIPTSENQAHIFADKQLRKEGKMNSAVEKLLNRPNIITCSELNKYNGINNDKAKTPDSIVYTNNELNVGVSANNVLPADDVSSDSCCSILLGYVDDQCGLVKQDLQHEPKNEANQTQKQIRLKNLLKRLDELRNSLVKELKTESESSKNKVSKSSSKEENLRQAIDSINELRKEREQILVNEIAQEPKPIRDREKELQAKEAILEEKVREFYELQKQQQNPTGKTTEKKLSNQDINMESKKKTSSNKQVLEEGNTEKVKENVICTPIENPLEIIITVRGESQSIKIPQKPMRKSKVYKSPSKLGSLIRSPQTKRHTPKKKPPVAKPPLGDEILKRQNSYDSNSTSYMSLPTELHTKIDDLATRIAKERQQHPAATSSMLVEPSEPENVSRQQREKHRNISSILDAQPASDNSIEPLDNTLGYQPPARVNPLIAQYVQRLLGMTRNNIQKLGVSSSDIETPGSSIINTSANITTSSDTIISEEHLINVQHFVDENRSFIKDLEQSIRSQNNESLENSLRTFDGIWRQHLRNQSKKHKPTSKQSKQRQGNAQAKTSVPSKESRNREGKEKSPAKEKPSNKKQPKDQSLHKKSSDEKEKARRTKELMDIISSGSQKPASNEESTHQTSSTDRDKIPRDTPKNSKAYTEDANKDLEKTQSSQYSTDDKETSRPLKKRSRPVKKVDVAIETKLSQESNKTEGDSQIARYAKLTENCTHRIAELTELINRVREEKQRLLEVTLSSVSDTGRQSTEYLELPDGKSSTRNDQEDLTRISSSSEETTHNKQTRQTPDTAQDLPQLISSDKNKQTAASRDSGIADSRPVTAQGNPVDPEPISHSSSETNIPHPHRKMKPPPTMKRFSPQLPDDELAHELSTILEVDTPATSRITTAVGQVADDATTPQQPIMFPTFEQYVRHLDLDITQLDPEQSMQLKNDFCCYLECLQQQYSTSIYPPQYNEFPSLNAYIAEVLDGENAATIEESLAQLHISGINPQNFPAVREYIQRNASKASTENLQLIDTDSLENITGEPVITNTEDDSGSMDIENELKQRKIMKNSFRYFQRKQQKVFSSTANKDTAFYQEIVAAESGIDKLSTSDNTMGGILESDLRRMVHQWPGEVRRKSQQYHILSSTTTSANTSALANSALKATSMDDSSKDVGRPLNLRDFLTRELLKHANISASLSSSSSDESLRSHFLHSIIGSLTPRTTGAASKSGAQTLDRQKTSTPVPMQSSHTHSTTSNGSYTSSQLFSGESRISSVHYDRSVRFFTSDGGNADHSSE